MYQTKWNERKSLLLCKHYKWRNQCIQRKHWEEKETEEKTKIS